MQKWRLVVHLHLNQPPWGKYLPLNAAVHSVTTQSLHFTAGEALLGVFIWEFQQYSPMLWLKMRFAGANLTKAVQKPVTPQWNRINTFDFAPGFSERLPSVTLHRKSLSVLIFFLATIGCSVASFDLCL